LKGDIGRMNTVFKLYIQSWVMLSIASAYALTRLISSLGRRDPELSADEGRLESRTWSLTIWRRVWLAALAFLVVAVSLYPIVATPVRLEDRFNELPPTPDGMAYME